MYYICAVGRSLARTSDSAGLSGVVRLRAVNMQHWVPASSCCSLEWACLLSSAVFMATKKAGAHSSLHVAQLTVAAYQREESTRPDTQQNVSSICAGNRLQVRRVRFVQEALNCSGMPSTCADEINTHRPEWQEGFSSLFTDGNNEPVIKSL